MNEDGKLNKKKKKGTKTQNNIFSFFERESQTHDRGGVAYQPACRRGKQLKKGEKR